MMEKKLGIGWLIIAYVLLALSVGIGVYLLIVGVNGMKITAVMEILVILTAIVYFAKGYKKDAAKYFKTTMFLVAITFVIDYISLTIFPVKMNTGRWTYLNVALILILYGNFLLLAVGKDLGKKWSYILVTVNLVFYIYNLISTILFNNSDVSVVLSAIEFCATALVSIIMVKAKYIDKSNRTEKE